MVWMRLPCTAVVALAMGHAAFAQTIAGAPAKDYPSRFIRIVIPHGPGTGPDVVGRILAEKMRDRLGQKFVFENAGGGGIPGTDFEATPSVLTDESSGSTTIGLAHPQESQTA